MRIRTLLAKSFVFTMLGALSAATGCAASEDGSVEGGPSAAPHVLALSKYSASLGESIDGAIENPPELKVRSIELVFNGTFFRGGGGEERVVDLKQPVQRTDGGSFRWTTFGPFGNPFTPKNPDIGTFRGNVKLLVTKNDGTQSTDDRPLPVEIEVKPSIILTELQPTIVETDCGKPALRLIGQLSYKMKAQAIGFKPSVIEYQFTTPGVVADNEGRPTLEKDASGKPMSKVTTVSHEVSQPFDAIDGTEVITLPPVPDDMKNYGVIFNLTARDETGRYVRSTFGMTAHKPLEIYDDNRYALAEIYPAVPVSGCFPGGPNGREARYEDTKTETKQRSVTITLSSHWTKGEENSFSTTDGRSYSSSKTETNGYSKTTGTQNTISSETNGSNTSGLSTTWNAGGNAGVDIKVFNVGGSYGYSRQTDTGSSSGWSKGTSTTTFDQETVEHSTATTDTNEVNHSETNGQSNSSSVGGDQTESQEWSVSSAQTIGNSISGAIVANRSGQWYRQLARYTRRQFVIAYNLCGDGDAIGDITGQDWVWSVDLADGPDCKTPPQTTLEKPQCLLPPCDNL